MTENYITYDQMSVAEEWQYIGKTGIRQLLAKAYNIIFNKNFPRIKRGGKLDIVTIIGAQQKQHLNKLIQSVLELAHMGVKKKYSQEEFFNILKNEPECIRHYLLWGMDIYFYEISKNKPSYKNFIKENPWWLAYPFVPQEIKTRGKRKFTKQYSGTPEQIYSACVCYIINFAIDDLKSKNIEQYGKLLIDCCLLLEEAHRMYVATKNSKIIADERLNETAADFEYFCEMYNEGHYSDLSRDEAIEKVRKDHNVGIRMAENFLRDVDFSKKKKDST